MKSTTLFPALLAFLAAQLPYTTAQDNGPAAPSTTTLTMLDPSGSTITVAIPLVASTPSLALHQQRQEPSPTPTADSQSEPSTTSVLQATRTESVYIPTASSSSTLNADGIDVEAGASGSSSGGFSLSKGGMIAVIVVVVCVAVFGVLSITLFIIAKKRQWRIRESIKRASRRLTGRTVPRSDVDRRKRSGVIAGSKSTMAPPGTPLVRQKGTAVSETEMRDLEKGEGGKGGKEGAKGRDGWLRKMQANDWR